MNIVVCVKSVPGIIKSITITDNSTRLEPQVGSICMNETDEYALDEALILRKEVGGRVTAISVGPKSSDEKLLVALAKGADNALRLDNTSDNPAITSLVLAKAISGMKYDLILTGLESNDNMAAQVGIGLAERLGIPFIFAATKIELLPDNLIRVTREMGDSYSEILDVSLPALIAVQTGIQPLSYAPVAKLFQAKRRGIDSVTLTGLGIGKDELNNQKSWRYTEILKPHKKRETEVISGIPKEVAARLLSKIRNN